ncbi:MAG: glycosyltransferase family 39 protein [Candidatus Melainabacteria bacterium]|nr:glycosyltransferase family 39 protein [Candidatus Melainabacteria bacterium]
MALIVILILINLACFACTLNGYFLADDFVHIPYLVKVFQGHPVLLWQNFFSNWMQTQGTQFYRPLISLTLALDYLLYGTNPIGYHVSNTFFQILSSIFLFLLSRRILSPYGQRPATIAAFFAGSLFAAHPLHPEVVSWVIGRVDSVCTMFYLASLFLFVKSVQDSSRASIWASILTFALSLLSKEMAVTLPATATFYCIIAAGKSSIRERFSLAIAQSFHLWLVLAGYFIVRTLSLGTISGGYLGSIGEGLSASLYKRFFLDGSFVRVLFPFNEELFGSTNCLRLLLRLMYLMAGLSIAVRLLTHPRSSGLSRYIVFALGWLVLSLVPAYQVWNLTETLQGGRFAYLATAPLCLLMVLLVLPMAPSSHNALKLGWTKWANIIGRVLLTGFVLSFAFMTYKNNLPWAQASAQVRTLRSSIENALATLPAKTKLVLLNLPQRIHGAHMLYNAAMLDILLNPPLSPPGLSARVVTFEPMTYGDSELLIIARLRRLLKTPDSYAFYEWDQQQSQLIPIKLVASNKAISLGGLSLKALAPNSFLVSPQLDLPSTATDFVDVCLVSKRATSAPEQISGPDHLFLWWSCVSDPFFSSSRRLALPLVPDGAQHCYRFNVSQHKTWLMAERINQIRLDLPTQYNYNLKGVYLLTGDNALPCLEADESTLQEDNSGVWRMKSAICTFSYDASTIPGATQVAVEISKPDAWFEHYSGELRDSRLSEHALTHWQLNNVKGRFDIPLTAFPSAGYYEVRVAAANNNNKVLGYVSDPINLQIGPEQFSSLRH